MARIQLDKNLTPEEAQSLVTILKALSDPRGLPPAAVSELGKPSDSASHTIGSLSLGGAGACLADVAGTAGGCQ